MLPPGTYSSRMWSACVENKAHRQGKGQRTSVVAQGVRAPLDAAVLGLKPVASSWGLRTAPQAK